ncbi:MAG: hypothetical protein ACXAC5_06460 [Promethearchaeota archaeon]|jgi:hypothetical protein
MFIFLLFKNPSGLGTFFKEYLISGKSLFLPFLPYDNILWFLPEEGQFIHFSTGHLLDIILIINIAGIVEISGHHYFIKVCLNRNYIETCILESEGQFCELSQDSDLFFGLTQYSKHNLEEEVLNIKFKQNKNFYGNTKHFDDYSREERYTNNPVRNGILPKAIFENYFKKQLFFKYLSDCNKFFNTHVTNQILYPQISNFTTFPNYLKQEG